MKHGELLIAIRYNWYQTKHSFKYRHDPVPFIGKYSNGSGFKRIRTKQEATINCSCKYVRPKRKKLPTAWDDRMRSDFDDKCWKRYRKTQYK